MNKFEATFFKKYVSDNDNINEVLHKHIIVIIDSVIVKLILFVILPSFIYYFSERFQSLAPFYYLETFLIIIFFKLIYDIFNWYNDVWILTDNEIISLEWSLFGTETTSIKYDNIEGIEVEQDGFVNTVLSKGNIILNRIGSGEFKMVNGNNVIDSEGKIKNLWGNISKGNKDEDISNTGKFSNEIMEALSGVVKEYLNKNGLENEDNSINSQILEEKKEKLRQTSGTIDLG